MKFREKLQNKHTKFNKWTYKSLITDVLENTYFTQNFILHKLFSFKYSTIAILE